MFKRKLNPMVEHKLLRMATKRRLDELNTVRLEEHRKLNEQRLQELLR